MEDDDLNEKGMQQMKTAATARHGMQQKKVAGNFGFPLTMSNEISKNAPQFYPQFPIAICVLNFLWCAPTSTLFCNHLIFHFFIVSFPFVRLLIFRTPAHISLHFECSSLLRNTNQIKK